MNSLEKAILFLVISDAVMFAISSSVEGCELFGVILVTCSSFCISLFSLTGVTRKAKQLQSVKLNFMKKAVSLLIILNVLALALALVAKFEKFGVIFFICSSFLTTIFSLVAIRQESTQLQSEDCYESLSPTKEFQQEDIETGSQCAICLKEFKSEEQIQPFGECVHVFHSSCLNSGLLDGKITCPVCSQGLKIDIC